jgi:hypothetical protein
MSHVASAWRNRLHWFLACALGEAAGIAVVATTYAAMDRGLLTGLALPSLAAGAWEGACLGTAQALILRRFRIAAPRWIGLTLAAAVLGYGLSLLGGAGQGGDGQAEPSLAMMGLLGAGLGVVMGAMMGTLQALAGRGRLRARRWICANMAGWAPAMAAIMLGAGSVDASFSLACIATAGAVSGAIAGLALGVITGFALPAGAGKG